MLPIFPYNQVKSVHYTPGYHDYPVVPDDGGEVLLVPEPGHGEALQEVSPAKQLEGERALGGGAELRQPGQ